jgi:hypothetical protein
MDRPTENPAPSETKRGPSGLRRGPEGDGFCKMNYSVLVDRSGARPDRPRLPLSDI